MAGPVRFSTFLAVTLAATSLFLAARSPAQAPQPPAAKPEMRENCPGLVASDMRRAIPAAFRVALAPDQVRVNYAARSANQVRAAWMGAEPERAGAARSPGQGRARAQRADQHPHLERRHRAAR